MCKVETGGHVSENLTLVTSPVTGVDRKLLGDPRMFWGHPREGTRGRDRVLGALQSPAVDPPPSCGRSKGYRCGRWRFTPNRQAGCFASSRRNQVLGRIGEEGLDS